MTTFTKLLPAILTALLIFTMMEEPSFAMEENKPEIPVTETDRVIVTLEEPGAVQFKQADVTVLETVEDVEIVSVQIPEGENLDSYIEELEKREGVESVEPDYLMQKTYVPNDPYAADQYHHVNVGTPKAWNRTKGSADVMVAVIDGGFDVRHPDLIDQIYSSYSTVTDSKAGVVVGDHGTHVAGIIGSSMDNFDFGTGVAPKSELLLVDVFDGEDALTSNVVKGIHYAIAQGADIINMSMGGYRYSLALNDAVQYAHSKGIVIIAAAGNDDVDSPHYPSSLKNVISVGATDSLDDITDYTNYGDDIDLVAPGTDILSTLPQQDFGFMTGTSMAAPVVSGVAALILANEPLLTNKEVEQRLFSTATDLGEPGKDYLFGNGLVDAPASLMPDRTERISGLSRSATAVAISKKGWQSANTVVLATSTNFPDALAGGPLAYKENAPILLTRPASLTPETKAEIQRLGASRVYILGSKGAISTEVQEELKNMGLSTVRIGGKNRYETAAMIAKKLPSTQSVVANGSSFPDVLSISSYAARNGIPILLTRTTSLPAETAAAIQSKSKTHVIGGTGAVNATVFSSLPGAVRYGGQNRYETGAIVMKRLPMGTAKAYVATGQNFPDALAGSVLAAKNNAPILLVKNNSVPVATQSQFPTYGSFGIFGGTGAVGREVVKVLNWEVGNR